MYKKTKPNFTQYPKCTNYFTHYRNKIPNKLKISKNSTRTFTYNIIKIKTHKRKISPTHNQQNTK